MCQDWRDRRQAPRLLSHYTTENNRIYDFLPSLVTAISRTCTVHICESKHVWQASHTLLEEELWVGLMQSHPASAVTSIASASSPVWPKPWQPWSQIEFIDFRKAFDTVDHSILLQKLYHYGIRGVAYDWFCDYLKNRTQLVSYHNIQSNYADISCGVPQGSILGPLLFLIYINDMAFVSTQLFSILFADDTNMFGTDNNLEALIVNVNT